MKDQQAQTAAPDAMADFNIILTLAGTRPDSAGQLLDQLRRIYAIAAAADISRYDYAMIKQSAPDLLAGTGHLRLALRDQIPDWQQRGLMTPDVQAALRDVFRILRYAADMLGEMVIDHRRLGDGEALHAFAGPGLPTFFHASESNAGKIVFQSGDVLMVRGRHNNSAAIARIGDVDSQFSHVCIIHIDEAGQQWVVESLIEEGAIINTLEHELAHGIGRAVLYRYKDPQLAARAARAIFEHVQKSRKRWFGHIPYDFTMQLTGYRQLFCSKLLRQAFELGSHGRVLLPTYKTSFRHASRDFLDRIGVRANETFVPADLELESDFRMIAEWADHRVTSDLRLQDMALSAMFDWMEKDGWRFEEDWLISLVGWFGRWSARWSEGVKDLLSDLIPKIPRNMKRRTIATVAMLHKTTEPLLEQLRVIERNAIDQTGFPMHGREALEHLENIRAAAGGKIGYLVAPRR